MRSISRYITRFVDTRAIFIIDLAISVISSIVVLLTANFLSGSDFYRGAFATWWIGGNIVFSILTMILFKSHNVIIRHATFMDTKYYAYGIFLTNLLLGILITLTCGLNVEIGAALFANFLLTTVAVLAVRFMMIDFYRYYTAKVKNISHDKRILIFGTGGKAISAISRLERSKEYHLLGFLSTLPEDKNLKLADYPIYSYSNEAEFKSIANDINLTAVLFVTGTDLKSEENKAVKLCTDNQVLPLIVPTVDEMIKSTVKNRKNIRKVKIEDLLGRPEIEISLEAIKANFKDKVIMVTGAAGSIGSELCRQLAHFNVKKLVLYDNAETPMHNLRLELEEKFPQLDFVPVIGSVRHGSRLDFAFDRHHPQVVFHAAAYKHVPLMEENPCEAIFSNVYGTRQVADRCIANDVEMMVMISTDKAVNPTNVMGCSKRLAEIYVQSLGLAINNGEINGRTKFVTTRFGNVLGSNGSVIPRFREQIEQGGPVTVTHPDINRFFMTIPEACHLVMEAATMSTGNQIFVFDMGEPVKIVDLATKMIELAGLKVGEDIQIVFTGLRPGEKLYEEVLADAEKTEPTSHDRIRIAKVREYDYNCIRPALEELSALSKAGKIEEMVKLMKKLVPEFKSQNSRFEEFDHVAPEG